MNDFQIAMLTNDAVIRVTMASERNRQVSLPARATLRSTVVYVDDSLIIDVLLQEVWLTPSSKLETSHSCSHTHII